MEWRETMDGMSDFLVKRDDLRSCRVAASEPIEVGQGQALLRVDCFGLTANNVTYGVMGEAMSYWDFFPAADGWGRMPVWGFAEVERSEADGVAAGTRVYGYLPPSSHLLVTPGEAVTTTVAIRTSKGMVMRRHHGRWPPWPTEAAPVPRSTADGGGSWGLSRRVSMRCTLG